MNFVCEILQKIREKKRYNQNNIFGCFYSKLVHETRDISWNVFNCCFIVRYSSILERNPVYLGSSSDMSCRLPPPSPSLRRSSTQDILSLPRHRRSGTFDPPDLSRDSLIYPREGGREVNLREGSRDTPAYSREGSRDTPVYSREGSVYSGRDTSSSRNTPNYSRYSSILDDKHNWGFSTLRRRNSKSSF